MSKSAIELNMQELIQNQSVGDVEDLPELMTLPVGTYRLKGLSVKPGESAKQNPKVGVTMELKEIIEVAQSELDAGVNPEDYPEGTMTHFTFADKEAGKVLSKLKKPFGDTMAENGMSTFAELFEQFDQLEFICQVTRRKGPDHTDDVPQYFGELVMATVA